MEKFNTEGQHSMASTNQKDQTVLERKVWSSLKTAIELNLSITETALWATITVLKRVRALKRDMAKTSLREKCRLRTGRTRNFGLAPKDLRNHHQNHKNLHEVLKDDEC